RLQVALIAEPGPDPAARRRPLRVVDFANLAVVAILGEVAGASEHVDPVARRILNLARNVSILDIGVVVDWTALAFGDNRESIGVQETAFDRDPDLAPLIAAKEIKFRTRLVAVLWFEFQRTSCRPAGNDVDHPTHRDVAVQIGRCTLGNLDPVNAGERDPAPIHPTAERIVERNAVEQDERAALTART